MVGEEGAWRREREAIVGAVGAVLGDRQDVDIPYLDKLERIKTEGRSVILVDDNNYLASMRLAYYRLARARGVGFCQILVQVGARVRIREGVGLVGTLHYAG